MRRLLLVLLALVAAPVSAQTPLSVQAIDSSSFANVRFGDAGNSAVRVNCIVGCTAPIVDGTAFVSASSSVFTTGFRRDDATLSVGAACGDGDLCPAAMGQYGNVWTSYIDPATGLPITFGGDATYGATQIPNGPQGILAYRADLDSIALVADTQATRALSDGMGRALQGGHCPPGNIIDGQVTITDGSSTSVVGAGGASVVNEIWEVDLGNTSGSNITVDMRDGVAGAVLRTFTIPSGGAISRPLTVPIRTTANTILAADPSGAATSIIISLAGCTTR